MATVKKDIHPQVHTTVVTCACGNSFETISTQESLRVEICSMCHPFYTGQQKFVDTEGIIDKFVKKQQIAEEKKKKAEEIKKQKEAKKSKKVEETGAEPTLKELLEQARTQTD